MSKRAIEQAICCTLVCSAFGVQAVGFGRTTPVAVLGQPLNVAIPIRTEPGEVLTSQCLAAEVIAGDAALPGNQVRVVLVQGSSERDWIAQISTSSPIEEPVVELALSVGCERRFMRRFTTLADPPTAASRSIPANMGITAPVMMGSSFSSNDLAPVVRVPKRARSVVDRESTASRGAVDSTSVKPSRSERRAEARAKKAKTKSGAPAAEITLAGAAMAPVANAAAPARRTSAVPTDAQMARLLLDVGAGPRLRMDIEEPLMRAPGGSVLPAASGALGGEAEGEDLRRLQALEKTLADLHRERQASVDATNSLRSRLADAESQSRLLPWLGGLLLLVGGVAMWLAMRMRKQGQQRDGAGTQWWSSAQTQDSRGPVPEPKVSGHDRYSAPLDQGQNAAKSAGTSVWEAAPAEESTLERTAVQPPTYGLSSASGSLIDGAAAIPREVSVEELLDLEQQADFFIALGQEDAAVDLLMTHLRGTGGLSPLPYTKLLEIYKRQGDPNAYERIRARFNRRFNVYAPDWEAGPLQGRSLEDYGDAVTHLQAVWASPLDAMAVLEAMLFRKDDAQDMFDLPAYKDVLLLYSLARDLWQQGGGSSSPAVDVLLPLGDAVASGTVDLDDGANSGGFQLTAFELSTNREGGELTDAPNTGAGNLTLERP